MLYTILEALLLATVLSMDALVVSAAYGTESIQISFTCACLISTVCSTFLGVSLLAGNIFKTVISPYMASHISFLVLFGLGVVKLFDDSNPKHSCTLSVVEVITLAASLSLDGLAAGFGAALADMRWYFVLPFSFVLGVAAVLAGCALGRILQKKSSGFPWLGGMLMMGLALTKIL